MHHGLALLPLFLLAAASPAYAAERSGDEIYAATCSQCHGLDGRGTPPGVTGLSVKPRDFTECRRTTPEADHDWYAVIVGGGPARGFDRMMPAFGEVLSESEQAAVLEFMRSLCPEPRWPRGDLNFPRPLVTEKAFVENELVLSGAMATRRPRNIDSRLIYEQRFLKRQMFELIVPFSVLRPEDSSRDAGIGDVAVALKTILLASLASGTILSLGGEAALPTGNKDKELGRGTVLFEPFLAFGQALPWESFLQVQTGAEIPAKEGSGLENEGFVRAALGTTFAYRRYGRNITPMVEAVAFRELKGGVPTSVDLVPQLQISLSRRQHVLAALGAYLPTANRADRPMQAMFYLLWDWFDGGLFEGW
jgi:mono/diheme cytochrome c family protein